MLKFNVSTGKRSMTFETNLIGIPFKAGIDFLNRCMYEFNRTVDSAKTFHDWSNLYYQTPQCDERFIR